MADRFNVAAATALAVRIPYKRCSNIFIVSIYNNRLVRGPITIYLLLPFVTSFVIPVIDYGSFNQSG